MDSHYPSSADLAAFRRSIELDTTGESFGETGEPARAYQGGAWPHEIEHGIGNAGDAFAFDPWLHSLARTEASRMRSAAFARQTDPHHCPDCVYVGSVDDVHDHACDA